MVIVLAAIPLAPSHGHASAAMTRQRWTKSTMRRTFPTTLRDAWNVIRMVEIDTCELDLFNRQLESTTEEQVQVPRSADHGFALSGNNLLTFARAVLQCFRGIFNLVGIIVFEGGRFLYEFEKFI